MDSIPIRHDRTPGTWLRLSRILMLFGGMLALVGCDASESMKTPDRRHQDTAQAPRQENQRMWMSIGERRFTVSLADTAAARTFARQLPLTLAMAELNGNEKHAELPSALPTEAMRPGTIRGGDVMLYGATTLVVFYETFQSNYSYTPIGRVEDPTALAAALGRGEAQVRFTTD